MQMEIVSYTTWWNRLKIVMNRVRWDTAICLLDRPQAQPLEQPLLFWITFVKWVIGFSTQVIANYFGTYKAVKGVHIRWPGGRTTPPKDSPDCGFQGELCINLGIGQPRLIEKHVSVCLMLLLARFATVSNFKKCLVSVSKGMFRFIWNRLTWICNVLLTWYVRRDRNELWVELKD